jgi:hypothetical protein
VTTKKVEILEGTEERVRERGFVYSSKQNNEDCKGKYLLVLRLRGHDICFYLSREYLICGFRLFGVYFIRPFFCCYFL